MPRNRAGGSDGRRRDVGASAVLCWLGRFITPSASLGDGRRARTSGCLCGDGAYVGRCRLVRFIVPSACRSGGRCGRRSGCRVADFRRSSPCWFWVSRMVATGCRQLLGSMQVVLLFRRVRVGCLPEVFLIPAPGDMTVVPLLLFLSSRPGQMIGGDSKCPVWRCWWMWPDHFFPSPLVVVV